MSEETDGALEVEAIEAPEAERPEAPEAGSLEADPLAWAREWIRDHAEELKANRGAIGELANVLKSLSRSPDPVVVDDTSSFARVAKIVAQTRAVDRARRPGSFDMDGFLEVLKILVRVAGIVA